MDIRQFQQAFIEESFEILNDMEKTLLGLDIYNIHPESINTLFRAMHSIKGSSATFGYQEIKELSHTIETFFTLIRNGSKSLTLNNINDLLKSIDCFRRMLSCAQQQTPVDNQAFQVLIKKFTQLIEGEGGAGENQEDKSNILKQHWKILFKPEPELFKYGNDPLFILRTLEEYGEIKTLVNINTLPYYSDLDPEKCYLSWEIHVNYPIEKQKLLEVFDWVSENSSITIVPLEENTQPAAITMLAESDSMSHAAPTDSPSIRVSANKVDALINTIGELTICRSALRQIAQLDELKEVKQLQDIVDDFAHKCQQLQQHALRIRMLPISFIFDRFPRLVRDCALELKKEIKFHITGEQTELDKALLEKLSDPLQHLLRNAVAHGIEAAEMRMATGKEPVGNIYLNAYEQGGNIVIMVSDDGCGLDIEKITAKARAKGLIKEGDELTEEKCYEIIFHPGFSTTEQANEISGRGVGLDVVKQNVQALGGNIIVETSVSQGTTFILRLPLTLAIMDCQLVKVRGFTYIIPLHVITEIIEVDGQAITQLDNDIKLYQLRNNYLNIIDLAELLANSRNEASPKQQFLVMVEVHQQILGLLVDELAEQQSIVIKNIEEHYQKVPGIAGATILGDGSVALVLDVNSLHKLKESQVNELAIEDEAQALAVSESEQFHEVHEAMQILSFYMAGEEYGIDIQEVLEIFSIGKITPLPLAPNYINGMANMRGVIIPVLDLSRRFNLMESYSNNGQDVTIILQNQAALKERHFAIKVDAIASTYQLTKEHIKPAPETVHSSLANNIIGIAMLNNKMITLLNCKNFLPTYIS